MIMMEMGTEMQAYVELGYERFDMIVGKELNIKSGNIITFNVEPIEDGTVFPRIRFTVESVQESSENKVLITIIRRYETRTIHNDIQLTRY